MTNYNITKPVSMLPPQRIKTFKIDTDPFEIKFVNQFKSICTGYVLHNHTGGGFTYQVNDENDIIDLKSLEERMENVQIESICIFGATDADLLVKMIPIATLQRYNALEVG
jgi:hypothetical protein